MDRQHLMLLLFILLGVPAVMASPRVLDLDSCRALAVGNNKELHMADMRMQTAYYNRKSAFTNYLPKVSAAGMYMHTGKELSLLSDEQKSALPDMGTALSMPDFWKYVSYLFPSTFGMNGYVRIASMGASLDDVRIEYMALWIQAAANVNSARLENQYTPESYSNEHIYCLITFIDNTWV